MSVNFKWITKEDIKGSFKMSANVSDADVEVAVNDAYNFDIIPTLPDALMNDIKDILLTNPKQWNSGKTYNTNDIVFFGGVYYKALTTTSSQPPNSDWGDLYIMEFWNNYIKPFFNSCAFYRFLIWHGANVTQYGLRQNNEETSAEITDKRKGELLADVSGKRDIWLARLTAKYSELKYTIDGVVYEYDSKDKQELNHGVRIWGVGKGKKKQVDCPDDYKYLYGFS